MAGVEAKLPVNKETGLAKVLIYSDFDGKLTVQELLKYQGFSEEELARLSILSTCTLLGDKDELVSTSLQGTQTAENSQYYVFDDSEADYQLMSNAVKDFVNNNSLVEGVNQEPRSFNWPQYTQVITNHLAKKLPALESKMPNVAGDNAASDVRGTPSLVKEADEKAINPDQYQKIIEKVRSTTAPWSADGVISDLQQDEFDKISQALSFLQAQPDTASSSLTQTILFSE